MSRIKQVLTDLDAIGKKALIPYITGGDPEPSLTVDIMHSLVDAGADIIELGIPFSDPMADGPVIQLACERALEHHVSLNDIFLMVKGFRKTNLITPVVLMGYLNPLEKKGYEKFAKEAAEAGVDGALIVDLPPEEAGTLVPFLKQNGLDSIFLIAPTTTEERIKSICEHSTGYVYYVAVKGVTGSASISQSEVADKLSIIKKYSQIPVGVGFGIRDAASAAEISKVANGVIVGSVIVNLIAENKNNPEKLKSEVKALVSSMRKAMDLAE
jgi:tryptophan synthase alpha chain